MNWNQFWTAFGAIGTTLAAFATVAAVLVALWQTKYYNRKKLLLSFSDSAIAVDSNTKNQVRYISISIINVGNRDVNICKWSISTGKLSEVIIFTGFVFDPRMKVDLPRKLPIEENLPIYFEYDRFCEIITKLIKDKQIEKNARIRFFIHDSTGKQYCILSKMPASKYNFEEQVK